GSTVREKLGIEFPGVALPVTYLATEGDIRGDLERGSVHYFMRAAGSMVMAPLRGGNVRMGAPIPEGTELTEATVQKVLRERGSDGLRAARLDTITTFTSQERIAATLRHGRCFLAGDAAHTWSPAGGIGANTGVQDGHNLAWKLAAVVDGRAAPSLLDSYEQERRPVARTLADLTELRQARRSGHNPQDDEIDDLHWALGQRYTSAAVLGPPHESVFADELDLRGLPGTRAPHLWLEHDGERIAVHDLCARRFVLLPTGRRGSTPLPR
ncbi:MAG: FAD-dependent monooxygenase, partial [Pseudonocardia sp.]